MRAYKFLARGAIGPLSGFPWPAPVGDAAGAWVETTGPLALCARGVHVCRTFDLAHWLHDELWELEAGGDQIDGVDCIVVRRARLVRRIDAWSDGGAARFAAACIEHAAAQLDEADAAVLALLDDARMAAEYGYGAIAAYSAALAVARLGDGERGYRRERVWQAAWITGELLAR